MNGNGHQQDGTGALLGANSVSSASTSKQEVKKKTRDSDCCSVNFLKYVLHIFNVVFMVSFYFEDCSIYVFVCRSVGCL